MGLWKRKIVVRDDDVTSAAMLTARQSLVPNLLGTWTFPIGTDIYIYIYYRKDICG